MGWEEDLKAATPRGLADIRQNVPAARWADPTALPASWEYNRKSLLLGYRPSADGRMRAIGCGDDRHVMLVAGSRAGKGVSFVIPNLLLYEGSVLAIDPKGELARETANQRAQMGQKVVVLDPFDISGEATRPFRGTFNPLDEIDPASPLAIDDAAVLADALVVEEGTSEKHWIWAARELVKGLILFALLQEAELRNLESVRGFFRSASGPKKAFEHLKGCGDAFGGLVAGIGASYAAREDRELSSILSTADVQLAFLDSTKIAECTRSSSFSLSDLKNPDAKTTVYLCLPAGRMGTHAKWLRMAISLALAMSERVAFKPDPPLLLLLEEFPVLGHMSQIEVAAGQIAGFGVKICTVLQDLTQLERHYGKSWETFLGNAGASIFFGNADNTTLDYVSKKLGTIGFDLERATNATQTDRLRGAKLIDEQLQLHRLLEPHEVELMFARETNRALVLYPGQSPLIVRRANYLDDPAFKGMTS